MAEHEKRIAVLIDADNAPAAKIDAILAEVARHGVANVRRAYGNWKSQHLVGWEKCLHTYAIRPIQQFAYTTGKNASDMAMVIDAMDLLYAGNLDGFAIVSSDADFTPLVMRLRNDGVAVYGFGQEKTPEPFVKACSTFLYLEKLGEPDAAEASAPTRARSEAELQADQALVRILRASVDATQGEDGWSRLGAVGSHVSNQGSFDSRNFGYRKLSDLIEATGLFEVRRQGLNIELRARGRGAASGGARPNAAEAGKAGKRAKAPANAPAGRTAKRAAPARRRSAAADTPGQDKTKP